MALENYLRTENYFQDLKEIKSILKPEDFDSQFQDLARYLNDVTAPAVNDLISGAIEGVVGLENTFLCHEKDGITSWQGITNDTVEDYSLNFAKLVKTVNQGSIIAADSDGILTEVTPTDSNQLLISNLGDLPSWSKVTEQHIEDRTITGNKIGRRVINNDHLAENIFVNRIADNSLTSNFFSNGAITGNKIQAGALNIDHIGVIGLSDAAKNQLNYFVQSYFGSPPPWQTGGYYAWIQEKTITPAKIKDKAIRSGINSSIRGLTPRVIAHKSFTYTTLGLEGNYFSFSKLHPNFRFQTHHLQNNSFYKNYFASDVQQAFTAKGC